MCCKVGKAIFIVMNSIFMIVGIILLGVGIWLKTSPNEMFEFLGNLKIESVGNLSDSVSTSSSKLLNTASVAMIVMGIYTLLAGLTGFFGAIKGAKTCLYVYAGLVVGVIIAEIGIGIYAGTQTKNLQATMEKTIKGVIKTDFNGMQNPDANTFTRTFSAVMIKFKCCGATGIDDFKKTKLDWKQKYNSKKQIHPIGCCPFKPEFEFKSKKRYTSAKLGRDMEDDTCPISKYATLNKVGCIKGIKDAIQSNMNIVIGACVGLGLLEILCVVAAILFTKNSDEDDMEQIDY